jgi:hypothetical protein
VNVREHPHRVVERVERRIDPRLSVSGVWDRRDIGLENLHAHPKALGRPLRFLCEKPAQLLSG